ncbi:MAG: ECF transporter S component [Oscillospiraceae bacterium]|nr:ECF transporter S component [Oscillospiraceae bacterium]
MKHRSDNVRYLTELALLVAIILVLKVTGLASVPVGPLVMTFSMIPIAIGAMLTGPLAGAILGMIYGFTSFYDAITGASIMTGIFFQLNPFSTFVLCVGTRTLVGLVTGWIFKLLKKIDRTHTVSYFITGLCAPLLNTFFFMGYIVVFFYNSEYVQSRVSDLGVSGPLMFVIATVGVQGLIEAVTGAVLGGGVGKTVAHALKRDNAPSKKKAE